MVLFTILYIYFHGLHFCMIGPNENDVLEKILLKHKLCFES